MAAVPYTGTQDVSPQVEPLSQVHLDTPNAAFGGAVAGAITHMGEVSQGAGKELFARAYAMQEMDELIKSDAASSDVMNKQTDRYLEFDKLQGQDRVNGLKQYQQDLQKIREDGMSELSSPLARQNYLNQTRRSENQMVWHGGVLARQGQEQAAKEATKLQLESLGDRLSTIDPKDPKEFDRNVDLIRAKASQGVQQNFGKAGFEPGTPQHDAAVASLVSPQVAKAIAARKLTDPIGAKSLLQSSVRSKILRPEEAIRLEGPVESAVNIKQAALFGHGAAQGIGIDLDKEQFKEEDFLPALKAAGPGGYELVGKDVVEGGQNKGHQVGQYGVNSLILPAMLAKLGKGGISEGEFLKDHDLQDEVAKQFGSVQKEAKSFGKGLTNWTGTKDPIVAGAALKSIAMNMDPGQLTKRVETAANQKDPGNVEFASNASHTALQHQHQETQLDQLTKFKNYAVATRTIDGSLSKDGSVPRSLDEAFSIPGFKDTFLSLTKPQQANIQNTIMRNNKTDGYVPNLKGTQDFERLMQKATDPTASPADREEALTADANQFSFTKTQRQKLLDAQHKIITRQDANPNLNHALGLGAVQQLLVDNYISKGTDAYRSFITKYGEAVSSYELGAHKTVKDDETLITIAQQMVAHRVSSWGHTLSFGFAGDPGTTSPTEDIYKARPDLRDQVIKSFRATNGREPSGAELEDLKSDTFRKMFELSGSQNQAKRTNRVK